MSDHEDDLRRVLGEELFNELDALEIPDYLDFKPFDEKRLMEIASTEYQITIAFPGEQALDLVAALVHAAETGCKECEALLIKFAGQAIGTMWVGILQSENLLDEEDEL